jgi:crotonobetainyl-CoA:carnitine CoA-transferase CaiB-like acyl-CoA transferase
MGELPDGVPPLFRYLEPILPGHVASGGLRPAAWSGPRRWWGGPLDVEGLALGAVGAAAEAVNLLAAAPDRFATTSALAAGAFDSSGYLRIDGRKIQGFAPLSGFRPTRDGWIRLHANYPHHEQRLLQALGAATAEQVAPALRSMTSLEAEAAILSRGGVAAAVRTREEWLATAMGRTAGTGPWIDVKLSDGAPQGTAPPRLSLEDRRRPLKGLRVLDLTRVIAGPVATRLLGALGAGVLRIDPPHLPEITGQFVDTGFDKRSAEADLATAVNRHLLHQLLQVADVVVMGYRGGSLNRFGLEPEALLNHRPELVVVTLDSWGNGGPWGGQRGFDSIVQAAAGIADLYGAESNDGGWRPGALPVQALDHATGYGMAAAAIALLTRRQQTGLGGWARLSLARTAEELLALPSASSQAGSTANPLPEPQLRTMASTYGELRYAVPPLLLDGQPLGYGRPPAPYGSAALAWA